MSEKFLHMPTESYQYEIKCFLLIRSLQHMEGIAEFVTLFHTSPLYCKTGLSSPCQCGKYNYELFHKPCLSSYEPCHSRECATNRVVLMVS